MRQKSRSDPQGGFAFVPAVYCLPPPYPHLPPSIRNPQSLLRLRGNHLHRPGVETHTKLRFPTPIVPHKQPAAVQPRRSRIPAALLGHLDVRLAHSHLVALLPQISWVAVVPVPASSSAVKAIKICESLPARPLPQPFPRSGSPKGRPQKCESRWPK